MKSASTPGLVSTLKSIKGSLKVRLRRVVRQLLPRRGEPSGQMRVHLGCGREYWQGWVNVDLDPGADFDLRCDFLEYCARLPDRSVDEFAMIHSLSYLRLWQARKLFRSIRRALKPHGRLTIELPDLVKCAQHAIEAEGRFDDYVEGVRAIYAFDLDQLQRHVEYTPYAFGWTGWHLAAELKDAGFPTVQLLAPKTHGARTWRDIRCEAVV